MSAETKMETGLIAEAQRLVGNLRWAYGDRRQNLPGFLEAGKRDRAYARLLDLFRSASGDLLVVGQAHQVLDADVALARKTFRDAADWLPVFEEVRQAATTADLKLSLNLMLEPIVCLLLANDWQALALIASLDDQRAFLDPEEEPKAWRAWAYFMRELLFALRAGETANRRAPEVPPEHTFAGYESLLNAILARDEQAFEKARAAAEAAYPSRKKKRDSTLNWFGYGKLAQLATFDALGTALCALAVHRGIQVAVDSPLYPRVFIHGEA
jgi:hypothetical protein